MNESEVSNYADESSIFVCDKNFENVISRLETDLPYQNTLILKNLNVL